MHENGDTRGEGRRDRSVAESGRGEGLDRRRGSLSDRVEGRKEKTSNRIEIEKRQRELRERRGSQAMEPTVNAK